MTVVDIALAANVSRRTVTRVAKDLFPGKMANGHRTVFLKEEAVKLMSELRKPGFVAVTPDASEPRQIGKVNLDKMARLPNGKQLEMLARIYGTNGEAAKRMDFLIGYTPVPEKLVAAVTAIPAPEPLATEDELDALMRTLRKQHGMAVGKVRGIGDIVERKALERHEAKIIQDQLNLKLNFNGAHR